MKIFFVYTFIFFSFFSALAQTKPSSASSAKGYLIKGKIVGVKNSEVYLAHYFGSTQQVVKDTAKADGEGNFTFKGKTELPKGLYLITFDQSKYLDFIMGNTNFSFETDTLDLINKMKIVGSDENQAFYSFQKEMVSLYEKLRSVPANDPRFAAIRKSILDYQQAWMLKNKNLFASKLIKATFEPDMPAFSKPVKNAKDSADLFQFQYRYYKKHFFDNVDLNDEKFIRTPFLQKKLEKFFTDLVVQESDSITKEADIILAKIKNEDVRKYVIYKISSTYENHNVIGTDAAFVHMSEKYYINEPKLWDTSTVRRIKERVKTIKPLLIGKKIPEMYLTDPAGKLLTLSTSPGNYTILFIYDPECSHCKEEAPKLVALNDYLKTKSAIVFAVSILREKEQWKKFIAEFKIQNWYNGVDVHVNSKTGKEEYYTDFKNTFDIYSTPIIYVLDRNKKIIGKRIPIESLKDFIEFHENKLSGKIK
jgi:hypothetical protein